MKENWSLEHWRLSWERTLFHCALFCLVCIFSSHVYYSLPFSSFSFSFIWPLMFLRCRVGLRNFHFNMVQYQALDWLLQKPKLFRSFYSESQWSIVLWSHCLINENPKAQRGSCWCLTHILGLISFLVSPKTTKSQMCPISWNEELQMTREFCWHRKGEFNRKLLSSL